MKESILPKFKTRETARNMVKQVKFLVGGETQLTVGEKQADGVWPLKFKGGTLSLPKQQ